MTSDEIREWADTLIRNQTKILHAEHLVFGQVVQFFDGETNKWKSTVNGEEVPAPVVVLDTGDAFRAEPSKFVAMNPAAVRFYEALQIGVAGLIAVGARNANAAGVAAEVGYALTIAALRAQLAQLERSQG